MAGQHPDLDPAPAFDAYDYIKIVLNPDGTVTRGLDDPTVPAVPDPDQPFAVCTKDVPLDQTHNAWARIYMPRPSPPPGQKLPLIVYYHGGGFIFFSPSSVMIHNFCSLMAAKLGAIIVAPSYHLAPEHRLPAAYDDAVEALRWFRTAEEEWLREGVDFSRCYVMGSSAGANIAYHVGLRAASADLEPLVIRGLFLHHPFFAGADRDHEYCNPTAGERPGEWERMRTKGWRVVVAGGGGDPTIDRQRELAAELEAEGVEVVGLFGGEGDYHGVEMMEPAKAELLFEKLKGIV
ncbi:hypothetical protein BT93_B1613 [Corymbia citriodora subsp. variegata]|nr:hypothetical protein BT93_B1613 [Corymbia citriodora subsp. variegata]